MSLADWDLCVRCYGREVVALDGEDGVCEVCADGANEVQRPLG